jgi:hypothetical protein
MKKEGRRGAFAIDAAAHVAAQAAKAAWWTAAGRAARAFVRPTQGEQAKSFEPTTPPGFRTLAISRATTGRTRGGSSWKR